MKSLIAILAVVLSISSLPCLAACPAADLNSDYFVDFEDFAILASQWLTDTPGDCFDVNVRGVLKVTGIDAGYYVDTSVVPIAADSGINPESLTFDLMSVVPTGNQKLLVYNEDFANRVNMNNYTLFTKVDWGNYMSGLATAPNLVWQPGELDVMNRSDSGDFITFWKTPIKFAGPAIYMSIDVNYLDTQAGVKIGMYKDLDNWFFFQISHDTKAYQFDLCRNYKGNEIVFSTSAEAVPSPPYKLVLGIYNNYVVLGIIDANNNYRWLNETLMTGTVFRDDRKTVLTENSFWTDWSLAWGVRCVSQSDATRTAVKIKGIQAGYVGASAPNRGVAMLKYEDGCPIIVDNCGYFATDNPAGKNLGTGAGINIFKLNFDTYKLDFTGRIFSTHDSNTFGNLCPIIIYDRPNNRWVYMADEYQGETLLRQVPYCGTTQENLLNGIHTIPVSPTTIEKSGGSTDPNYWDFDMMYDTSASAWRLICTNEDFGDSDTANYNKGVLYTSSSPLGPWTFVARTPYNGEGNKWTRCNGKWSITRAESDFTREEVLNYPALTNRSYIATTQWPHTAGAENCKGWGPVVARKNGDKTNYYLLIFADITWTGDLSFAYGPLWIYKARETVSGSEFISKDKIRF